MKHILITLSVCGISATLVGADLPSAADLEFFEKRIRPVLVENCYQCHSATSEKLKGGLRLDSRAGMLKGGESGAAIVPGKPDESLLVKAVRYKNEDTAMPPKKKLADAQVADLEVWVQLGSPWPEKDATVPVVDGKKVMTGENCALSIGRSGKW